MSNHTAFPVLTKDECRSVLEHVRTVGAVRFPWEFAAMTVAFLLSLSSCLLLITNNVALHLTAVLSLASALLLLQLLLHECAHNALFRSRLLNGAFGWLTGLFILTPFFSYRRGHSIHHSFLGTPLDPTAAPGSHRRWQRLLNFLVAVRVVPVLYLGGVYGPYLLFDFLRRKHQSSLCFAGYCCNLLAILLLHSLLATVIGVDRWLVCLAAAFWLSGLLYEYLFTQNQHVGLLPGGKAEAEGRYRFRQQVNFSRSVQLPCSGLFLYFNLHKEHHLFPHLPCRSLPRVHQWLQTHRRDVLEFTSEHLGVLQRRSDLNLFSPTAGD